MVKNNNNKYNKIEYSDSNRLKWNGKCTNCRD